MIHNIFLNEETREELEEAIATVMANLPPEAHNTTITTKRYDSATGLWIAKGYYYDTTGD